MTATVAVTSAERTRDITGLRVLFCAYYWLPYRSGMTLDLSSVAAELATRGAAVRALVGRHDRSLAKAELVDGVTVRRIPVLARYDRAIVLPTLIPALAREAARADVVVLGMPLGEAAALARLVSPHRLVTYYICDPALPQRRLGKGLMWAVDRSAAIAVRRAATVVATSEDYARHSRVLSEVADRVVGIPPILDLDRMRSPERPSRPDDGQPRIGYLGRIVHEKGLDVLIRAVAQLPGPADLVLAGDAAAVAGGSELPRLQALAAELGVSVDYAGPLADDAVPAFLASVDVLALPSVSTLEAWGRVQAEAMLCGTPVVASALPGVRELVRATGMGLTVPPGDAAALASALSQVIDVPDRFTRSRPEVIAALGLDRVPERHVAAIAALGRRER